MHRILIIDDLQSIHDDFRKTLTGGNASSELGAAKAALFGAEAPAKDARPTFEVDHALQGEDGWRKVQASVRENKRYTVAFVDMRMPPGWNGLQTIQRLWEEDAELQIVICTAYSDQSWEEITSTLGLTDRLLILKKPFDPVEVMQLATALSEKWVLKHQATLKLDELERLVQQRTCQLAYDSTHDALTNLPNRVMFRKHMAGVVEHCAANKASNFALYFLDFDRFKIVNDSLGHDAGDDLLKQIAERLIACTSSPAFTSRCAQALPVRLGGDEFIVLVQDYKQPSDPTALAKLLLNSLEESYALKSYKITTSASIGLTTSDIGYTDAEAAIRDADTAMYRAKAAGKAQYVVFDKRMHEEAHMRLSLENDLRNAIERDELILNYQPVVELTSSALTGFEVLVRWNHPERGMVMPDKFIPCAEETAMIGPIGLWVLRNACKQFGEWRRSFKEAEPLTMSVNVSARQLMIPGFVEQVKAAIADSGIPASSLALEITETAVISDPKAATALMLELKNLGVRIYMDDFGTGYSSLSYLHHLPLNALKIDRSFLASISERKEYAAVVYAIVTLARNLGLTVIAEGVEKPEQVAMLQAMECDFAQGYLFGRPGTAKQAEAFMLKPAMQLAA